MIYFSITVWDRNVSIPKMMNSLKNLIDWSDKNKISSTLKDRVLDAFFVASASAPESMDADADARCKKKYIQNSGQV